MNLGVIYVISIFLVIATSYLIINLKQLNDAQQKHGE